MTDRKLAYGRAQLDRATLADDGPLTFVASTSTMNRKGFALRNDGWRLDNFNANPVLLWMHNPMQPPIGRGHALSKDGKVILDAVTFDREDELARAVESKFRRGFLNAVSVSWDFMEADGTPVLDWWRLSTEKIRDEMFYDLAEVSAVTVPGDPRALQQQSRLALRELGRELVELFDEQENPDSPVTAEQVREAVAAELMRLGIHIPAAAMGGIPSHNTAVVEGTWDGPAAQAAAPNDRTVLRHMHAWVDAEGDADAKSSYKFPHHAAAGSPANLNGVRNALARLPQADIPEADRAAVERHLRNHLDAQTENARPGGIDASAAQAILAAFNLQKETTDE